MDEAAAGKYISTIVVVGAAGGIGRQVALQLAGKARVIAVARNTAVVMSLAACAEDAIECDLANANSVRQAVTAVRSRCPHVDGLIICSAVQPVGPVELAARDEVEQVFAVNVFGTLQFVQGVLPGLRHSGGRIVLFSSLQGRIAGPMVGTYAASKFALEAFADALRRELSGSGVSLSLVEPGSVNTAMANAQGPLVNALLTRIDAEEMRLHGSLIRGYKALAQNGLRMAAAPERVARCAVEIVLGLRRAKPRHVVGADARAVLFLSKILPTRLFDSLLMKMVQPKK